MNADSRNPQTIDGIVSTHPRFDGIGLAEKLYHASLKCDYLVSYGELELNRGFALYYDESKTTAAEAIKDFKDKFDLLKEWARDSRIVDVKVYATSYSVKNNHILVNPDSFNENSIAFTNGLIKGYMKMMGISETPF